LVGLGIPRQDIIIEAQSKNTYENAIFSAKIIKEEFQDPNLLLITSAWHLPRAERCFHKAGVTFTSFGVDYLTEANIGIGSLLLPSTHIMLKWEFLIKEWVGYWVYRFTGYA